MKKVPIIFKCYDSDGYEYSSRFDFLPRGRYISERVFELYNESDAVARVVAYDYDTGNQICEYPKLRGGYRPGGGRPVTDGVHRPCRCSVMVESDVYNYLKTQKNLSAFVNALVKAYMKNTGVL